MLGKFHARTFLEFDRDAESMLEAVASALNDAHKAGLEVERIGLGDLVTPAEIARRTGRTRASISQLIRGERGPGGFPAPVQVSPQSSLWLWPEVSDWLNGHEAGLPKTPVESELRAIDLAYQFLRRVPNRKNRQRILQQLEQAGTREQA